MKSSLIAAVVILYNPKKDVYENIITYANQVDKLYIIDNSDQQHCLNYKNISKVDVLHQGENIGIAKALNLALSKAYQDAYTWLMTFDQDTAFKNNDLEIFLEDVDNFKEEKIALLSPLHNYKFIKSHKEAIFTQSTHVMTSANLVNIAIAQKIGGYNEKLFIDEVDHDFCFRLVKNGYTIFIHHGIAVIHRLGKRHIEKKKVALYDPSRLYYMTRNYLYLRKKYFKEDQDFFKNRNYYLLSFFKNQLIYGEHPMKNIYMIFRGVIDYKFNIYGKLKV